MEQLSTLSLYAEEGAHLVCVLYTPQTKVLVELGKTQDNSARKLDEKALMLLGEILHLSDILMPASQCANIQVCTSPTNK